MKKLLNKKGFTLIELLVVIGIIAVLAAVVIIAINPARQFAQARDTQRWANVNAILNAIGQNMADNRGVFTCAAGTLPDTITELSSTGYDIGECISPTYISTLPMDPSTGTGTFTNPGDTYDTGYRVIFDSTTRRVTVSANGEVPVGTDNVAVTR